MGVFWRAGVGMGLVCVCFWRTWVRCGVGVLGGGGCFGSLEGVGVSGEGRSRGLVWLGL